MSDSIMTRSKSSTDHIKCRYLKNFILVDDMGRRIDDLERNIAHIISQTNAELPWYIERASCFYFSFFLIVVVFIWHVDYQSKKNKPTSVSQIIFISISISFSFYKIIQIVSKTVDVYSIMKEKKS